MKSIRTHTGILLRSLSVLLAITLPVASGALESDMTQPIMIEADSLEINDREGTSIYRGNVVVNQGTIRITADSVKVTQRKGRADHILAKGKPVFFRQQTDAKGQTVEGTANKAEYDAYINQLEKDIPDFRDRLFIKPGITGLAQVINGYDDGVESARRKVELDKRYINNAGWSQDLKILVSTVGVVIKGEGAH